ncbi:MAG: Asp-tRNA(Asn)/Glu-tRNA(Gln) amidotransferase subunit GatC [Candidatus Limnocylindrus sp.]|jgi:aspartyl-tRNA(Asn)/glutamyl-tRNA(Gln) amidotransferase subunit C
MSELTRDEVERVAALARLGLTSDELGKLQGDLNLILEQWAHLAEVDTSSVPPSAQTIVQAMPLRDDIAEPSLPVDDALLNAPARSGDFVRVQAILSEEADG